MIGAPITLVPKPDGGIDESQLMDFAAALTITLPKNDKIKKMTIWLDNTGEPVEGYLGKQLYRHVKEWTKVKKRGTILETLQGLMYLRVVVCSATQDGAQEWTKFQDSDEYLYAFDASKINIYKCPSRGNDFVDMNRWNKYFDEDVDEEASSPHSALNKNKKVNKGGVVSTTYASPVEVTFTVIANEAKEKGDTQTHQRMMKVQEKHNNMRSTLTEINARRDKMKEQQKKINESQKKKGQREWKWKTSEKKEEKKEDQQVAKKKKHVIESKPVAKPKYEARIRSSSKTKVSATKVDYVGASYPIGSDNIKYYEKGAIVQVWSEKEKGWVNGVVVEVIKFVKTAKIKYEGKTQQFKIPCVEKVRLCQ